MVFLVLATVASGLQVGLVLAAATVVITMMVHIPLNNDSKRPVRRTRVADLNAI